MRVFISYTTRDNRDRDLARQIHDSLKARDVDVFFAGTTLLPGQNWAEQLRKELGEHCSHALFIISAASAMSEEVAREIEMALARQREDDAFVILPLLMGNVVNHRLGHLHYVPYHDDEERQVELVARALGLPVQSAEDRVLNPRPGSGGDLVPRMCDRRAQEDSFRSAFRIQIKKPAPQVYFISGAAGERHDSLVERFRWTYMHEAAKLKVHDDASVLLTKVPWAGSDEPDEAWEELLSNLFGEFDATYKVTAKPVTSDAFVALTRTHAANNFIAVQHEILSTSWSRNSAALLERYLQFWDEVAALRPAAQLFVFFNLVLCDSDEHNAEALTAFVASFNNHGEEAKPLWKRLTSLLGAPEVPRMAPPKHISITPLPALTPVRREDVDDWFDQRLRLYDFDKRKQLCDELFRSTAVRRMADVEPRLVDVYHDFQCEGRAS